MSNIKDIKIAKITINMGIGGNNEKLQRAEKLLEMLTQQKPVRTYAKATISEFDVKKHAPIGVKVTIRGKKAEEFLKNAFEAVENVMNSRQIDKGGNFSFGVKEYIEMPGMKYDPDIGMFGFDVCVEMERTGFRIKRRRNQRKKLPSKVKITPEEVKKYLTENYGVTIK